jgi:hypothetical protein
MAGEAAVRVEHLMRIRDEFLEEMAGTEAEMARLRTRVERLESEQRLGAKPTAEYQELKGHQLPRLESRLVDAYNGLRKVEDKILDARRGG